MPRTSWHFRAIRASRFLAAALGADETRRQQHQRRLAQHLSDLPFALAEARRLAGIDVHYEGDRARAAVTVLCARTLEPLETHFATGVPQAAYRFGMLAFRELPLVLAAAAKLDVAPDLCFYDGNGRLHPRGLGAASHFGLLMGVPTLGVSKNVRDLKPFPAPQRGQLRVLEAKRGALLVTRDETRPICVSPGHRIGLESALEAALATARYRLPEPVRLADQFARAGRQGH